MQIEKVLMSYPELSSNYLITLDKIDKQESLTVEVELKELPTDNYVVLENLHKKIRQDLRDEILVTPALKFVKKGSLPQQEGKAIRVKDLRKTKIDE